MHLVKCPKKNRSFGEDKEFINAVRELNLRCTVFYDTLFVMILRSRTVYCLFIDIVRMLVVN